MTERPSAPYPRMTGALIERPGEHDELVGGPNRDASEDLRVGVVPIPNEALGLVASLPPFKDQETTNTCFPTAIATAAETRLRALGVPVEPSSIPQLYCTANALIEAPDAPLRDVGTYGRIVMQVARDWGVARDTDYPLRDPRTGELVPGVATARVPGDVLQSASSWKLEEQLTVYATGADRLRTVETALHLLLEPVVTAGVVDAAFMAYDGRGVLGAPDLARAQGRHAVCIIGFRTNPRTARHEYLIRNSWRGWGFVLQNQVSLGWVDENWVLAQEELLRMRVTRGRRGLS